MTAPRSKRIRPLTDDTVTADDFAPEIAKRMLPASFDVTVRQTISTIVIGGGAEPYSEAAFKAIAAHDQPGVFEFTVAGYTTRVSVEHVEEPRDV